MVWNIWVIVRPEPTTRQGIEARRRMGLGRVELPTSRLSGVRSHQLSYRPTGVVVQRDKVELYSNNSVPGCQGQNTAQSGQISTHPAKLGTASRKCCARQLPYWRGN